MTLFLIDHLYVVETRKSWRQIHICSLELKDGQYISTLITDLDSKLHLWHQSVVNLPCDGNWDGMGETSVFFSKTKSCSFNQLTKVQVHLPLILLWLTHACTCTSTCTCMYIFSIFPSIKWDNYNYIIRLVENMYPAHFLK